MTRADETVDNPASARARRTALKWAGASIGAGVSVLAGMGVARTAAAQTPQKKSEAGSLKIRQPARPSPQAFMAEAARMRDMALTAGDQGFGAVVVKGQGAAARIVGLGPSRVVSNGDPTAHAEMEAVRDACRRLKTRNLSDCVLYSTFRPCAMCEAGAYWARVGRYVHGAGLTDGGAPKLGC